MYHGMNDVRVALDGYAIVPLENYNEIRLKAGIPLIGPGYAIPGQETINKHLSRWYTEATK
jgi:hypothetical protein